MAELRFVRFHGIRPAVHASLQLSGGATVGHAVEAINTRLQDGTLRAYRDDVAIGHLAFEPKTIARLPAMDCCGGVYALPYCADVLEMPAAACRGFGEVVIFSRDCAHEHTRCDPCTNRCYPLIVPAPTTPPVISSVGPSVASTQACGDLGPSTCSASGDHGCNVASGRGPEETSYVYTFVDRFGVESAPSPASNVQRKWDDQSVTVRFVGIDPPPNAIAIRLYRSVIDYPEGFDYSKPGAQDVLGASYQLVDEIDLPLASLNYTDDKTLAQLEGDLLQTEMGCPPPACFEQVVLLETGYYVGVVGNDIYISERHEPWNWPERYRLSLPDRIVGITAWDNHFFVGTTGFPYFVKVEPKPVQGQKLEQQAFDTVITPLQFPHRWPLLQRETLVSAPVGAFYVTHHGLVGLKPNGTAALVTRHRFDPDSWLNYAPNIAAWHDGRYVGVRSPFGRAIIIDMREAGEGGQPDFGDIVEVDLPARTLHAGRDGHLYYSYGTRIYRFLGANTLRPYRWRSRTFRAAAATRMGAAKVVGEYGPAVTFRLYADGRLVYEKPVGYAKPFRLPSHCRATEFVVEISGTTTVTEVHVGPSIRSLATNAASAGGGQGTGADATGGDGGAGAAGGIDAVS